MFGAIAFTHWQEIVEIIINDIKGRPWPGESEAQAKSTLIGIYEIRQVASSVLALQLTQPYGCPEHQLFILFTTTLYEFSLKSFDKKACTRIDMINHKILRYLDTAFPQGWINSMLGLEKTRLEWYDHFKHEINSGSSYYKTEMANVLNRKIPEALSWNEGYSNAPSGFVPTTTFKTEGLYNEFLWIWNEFSKRIPQDSFYRPRENGMIIPEIIKYEGYPHSNFTL